MPNSTSMLPSMAELDIDGLLRIDVKTVSDERGNVREVFRCSTYSGVGVLGERQWRQINLTQSRRGAVRGLHGESMNKLVMVAHGEAYGVYVDMRPGSPTIGRVVTVQLAPGIQVYVPRGVCNGFQSVSDEDSLYLYCFDNEWRAGMAGVALSPLDPALAIHWPIPINPADRAQISLKDATQPAFDKVLSELVGPDQL